jgi:fatty-acid desaturase
VDGLTQDIIVSGHTLHTLPDCHSEYFLAIAGAIQGSIKIWMRDSQAHHRYRDTDKDSYAASKVIFYSHLRWLIFKQDERPRVHVNTTDLDRDAVVTWQHQWDSGQIDQVR